MGRVEKTVFISYRRTNLPWALAIYQNLTAHGYDVFFDYESINSGDFEQIIIGNIRARAHFIVILTPSALERCDNPGDWLRREIETALDEKRNIVPLFLEGFSFGSPSIAPRLSGKLAQLKNYNGLNVPADYFDEAMERLCSRFLNIALDAVLHPVSAALEKAVRQQQTAASQAALMGPNELTAQQWWEKGLRADINVDEKIHCFTEAIKLAPDYATAYSSRGLAYRDRGDFDRAIQDLSEAIRLEPDPAHDYHQRGLARFNKGDLNGAVEDYDQAIRLKPEFGDAYINRGVVRQRRGDLDGAIQDYTRAIEIPDPLETDPSEFKIVDLPGGPIKYRVARRSDDYDLFNDLIAWSSRPNYATAYGNRGHARRAKGDLDGAMNDYSEALRLRPDDATVRTYRGLLRHQKGDLNGALEDYGEAIRLEPKSGLARVNRGNIRLARGDVEGAWGDFNETISANPDWPDPYKYRGILLEEKKRDYRSALADYQKYLDLGGTDKNVEKWIAKLKKKVR